MITILIISIAIIAITFIKIKNLQIHSQYYFILISQLKIFEYWQKIKDLKKSISHSRERILKIEKKCINKP